MANSSQEDAALFTVGGQKLSPGPVYQGVAKQIRALVAAGTVDKERHAGVAAAARSLAHNIDLASGHGGRRPSSGMQLSALHAQLERYLVLLAGEVAAGEDPFDKLLEELGQENGGERNAGRTAAPHPEV